MMRALRKEHVADGVSLLMIAIAIVGLAYVFLHA